MRKEIMVGEIILPEKDCFSIHEIMEQWGCDLEYMNYVFVQNKIRPAVQIRPLDRVFGVKLSDLPEIDADKKCPTWLEIYKAGDDISEFLLDALNCNRLEGFFYRTNMWAHTEAVDPTGIEHTCLLEDFYGNVYIPIEKEVHTLEGCEKEKLLLAHLSLGRLKSLGSQTFCDYLITREERDSYLASNGAISASTAKPDWNIFTLPPDNPDEAAKIMCEVGNKLAECLKRKPTKTELKREILSAFKEDASEVNNILEVGTIRVTKRGFSERYNNYLQK